MSKTPIHPQLLADCHRLGYVAPCHVLLHRNAVVPWFILVPDTTVIDLLDLETEQRIRVMDLAASIAEFVKQELRWPRVNVAAIGHLVPQLHLHVVGRRPGDACWPSPVWGHLEASSEYGDDTVQEIVTALDRRCGLQPSM